MNIHQSRVEAFMYQAEQEVPDKPTIPDLETRKLRAQLVMEEALELLEGLGILPVVNIDTELPFEDQVPENSVILDMQYFSFKDTGRADLVEIADACADLSVVTVGTASACGLDMEPILEEVDNNNLSKFSEGGYKDENGKWIKPPDWQPPRIEELIDEQRT